MTTTPPLRHRTVLIPVCAHAHVGILFTPNHPNVVTKRLNLLVNDVRKAC
jgi:hypothetical protein